MTASRKRSQRQRGGAVAVAADAAAEEDAPAHGWERRRAQQGQGDRVSATYMLEGGGSVVLDCNAILAEGPPVPKAAGATGPFTAPDVAVGEERGAVPGAVPIPGAVESAVESAGGYGDDDDRNTNGSFDEAVLMFQLCVEKVDEAMMDGLLSPVDEALLEGLLSSAPLEDAGAAVAASAHGCTYGPDLAAVRVHYTYDVEVSMETAMGMILPLAGPEYEAVMADYLAKELGLRSGDVADGRSGDVADGRSAAAADGRSAAAAGAAGGSSCVRARRVRRRSLLRRQEARRAEEEEEDEDGSVFLGLSSEPFDFPTTQECQNPRTDPDFVTSCYHMHGALQLYFAKDTSPEAIHAEAGHVLGLISEGMRTGAFRTASVPSATYMKEDYNEDHPQVMLVEAPEGPPPGTARPGLYRPTDPTIASATVVAGRSPSAPGRAALYGGIGAGALGAALLVGAVFALLVGRRRRSSAAMEPGLDLYGDPEIELGPDGAVIVDTSKLMQDRSPPGCGGGRDRATSNGSSTGGSNTLPHELSSSFEEGPGVGQDVVELAASSSESGGGSAGGSGVEDGAPASAAARQRRAPKGKGTARSVGGSTIERGSTGTASGSIGSHQGNVVSSIRTGLPQIIPSKGDVVAAMMGGEGCQPYAAKRQASEVMLPPPTPLPHLLGHLPASLDGPQLVPMDRINRTDEEDHVDNIDHDEHDVADDSSTDSEESGVTIELNTVSSTVSDITWANPPAGRGVSPAPHGTSVAATAVNDIFNRFTPYKSLYSPRDDTIAEGGEDEDRLDDSSMTVNDYVAEDEDDLMPPSNGVGGPPRNRMT